MYTVGSPPEAEECIMYIYMYLTSDPELGTILLQTHSCCTHGMIQNKSCEH